jgi:N-acyl-D-amino-acid deacylase
MEEQFDVLITKGQVIDGTGNPSFRADIGIQDGKISRIRRSLDSAKVKKVIDASEMIVCPGFIDVHTHDDLYVISKPSADEKIVQGITTVVTGNCGFSPAPFLRNSGETLQSFSGILGGAEILHKFHDVVTFGDYQEIVKECHPGINVASLVGNITIRINAMGHDMREPTDTELEIMRKLVSEAMADGAIGLSSGLIYAPGSYAQTDELIELCKVVKQYDGIYTSHIRGESDSLISSLQEAIDIGEKADIPVQISHFKVSGELNWGKSSEAIKLIEDARTGGIEITADQYPYSAGSTGMFALLPPDTLSVGMEELARNLKKTDFREKLKRRITSGEDDVSHGMMHEAQFQKIIVSTSQLHPEYEGKSLADIAQKTKQHPIDLVFDLVAQEKRGITMVMFSMGDEDIDRIMQSSFVMMGSDGLPSFGTKIHPRMTGTAPRILGKYVREKGILSLENAIRRMTSLPAQTFRFQSKGLLMKGFDADVVIFNPKTVADRSTYDDPYQSPEGIDYVLVNGEIAVKKNKVLGAKSGKVLKPYSRIGS